MSDVILEKVVLGDEALGRTMRRLAQEIVEANGGTDKLAIVGIHTGGVHLARRLVEQIQAAEGEKPSEGAIDITLYRDDLYTGLEKPVLGETKLPVALRGRTVVIVDDVLFTGRTVRAAMHELMDYGRPARIQLAVLVDRGHRELPIEANFVGRVMETQMDDRVHVTASVEPSPDDRITVERGGAK